ncbi:hypothetical protein [Reinekea sp.]|jgi:hypothetical protein|uniref:hypothetical protein n=1 Tax=Reinekea sp. TaxID=1970455 RepID=UPI002A8148E3|nr:hypothetical protein [Reinekea sp.]
MKYRYLTVFLTLFTANILAASFEEFMVFPGEEVHSKSLEDYANMWWQWTYTMPKDVSPVRDITGENCHVGQTGNVWFLAGGYGTSKISRECVIPQGKHIFFPVINMVYYPRQKGSLSCEDAKSAAALNNDELLSIEISLDSLVSSNPNHARISSAECFDLLGLVPEEYKAPRVYPSATDGFWIMLKPLSKGEHLLKFDAQYNRDRGGYSKMAQDIEYKLIVE